ncbi:MAG: 4Fe-4S dicluster domain-containing protein [Proteobacteria bacterium]|nr:4Fe-4S dicluster domain-containing protein [Pseudomonadota bacterium]
MTKRLTKSLKRADIEKLMKSVTSSGALFIAPISEGGYVSYKPVTGIDEVVFDYIIPTKSFKEFLFPQTESVARFTIGQHTVDVEPVEPDATERVIFGSRPCDAASVASLRSVATWDYVDEYYTKREDAATVITVACSTGDESCFCTAVELKPDTREGSDIMLLETEGEAYIVEALTSKGEHFIEKHADIFTDDKPAKALPIFEPEKLDGVDLKKISSFLKDTSHYENPMWQELASKCFGCGSCTYACPTCHCFDITDEGTAYEGERKKNWDACQFDSFTLHAGGHNPRDAQYKRWRNRFMCKFHIYPEKFETKGCVGCGRCIRVCPVRLDITEVMEAISNK